MLALWLVGFVAALVAAVFLWPKPNEADTIAHAMEVTSQLSGYHFVSSGVNSREGDWSAPDNVRMDVVAPKGKVSLIVIDKDPYIKFPAPDTFAHIVNAFPNRDPMSFSSGPLLSYFNRDEKSVRSVVNIGEDRIGGVDVVHYRYNYVLSHVMDVGEVGEEVWIQKSTGYVYQIRTIGDVPIVETYSRINEPVSPPIVAPGVFVEVQSNSEEFSRMLADAFGR